MNNILSQISNKFKYGGYLWRIIFINAGIFLLFSLIELFATLFQDVSIYRFFYNLFALPSNIYSLVFRFWTIVTYMFTQIGFFHLFFNMIMLYFSGKMLLQIVGEKKLLSIYLNGGFIAGLVYIISYNLFPFFSSSVEYSSLIGASGSIMAIFAFIAFYNPNQKVNLFGIFSVKLIHLAIAFIALDYIQLLNSNAGGHFAHIGGFLWGMFSSLQYKKGKDINKTTDSLINVVFELFYKLKNTFSKSKVKSSKAKFKTYERAQSNKQSKQDDVYNKNKKVQQEIIDEILDKIAAKGYDSLTKEEKAILFNASKN